MLKTYTTHKDMMIVVHRMQAWQHYLVCLKFVILIDNVCAEILQNPEEAYIIAGSMARILEDFKFTRECKPNRHNQVLDAPSVGARKQ